MSALIITSPELAKKSQGIKPRAVKTALILLWIAFVLGFFSQLVSPLPIAFFNVLPKIVTQVISERLLISLTLIIHALLYVGMAQALRWVWLAFLIIFLPSFLLALPSAIFLMGFVGFFAIIYQLQLLMQMTACVFLLSPKTRAWFSTQTGENSKSATLL